MDKTDENVMMIPTALRVLMPNGSVEEIKLETYLAGVVAAEMGIDAPVEALKAQAVAARTYAIAAQRHPEHNADVCTTEHCQKWKRVDPTTAPEVFRAVSETWGIVAMYDGQLINTFFFEHCDGRTRNAEEMHLPALPYLRGVDCSCGFLFLKGHGVGMCKRGAIVMARRNASFEQILRHYYRGVVIARMEVETAPVERIEVATPTPVETTDESKLRARPRKTPPSDVTPKSRRRVTRRAVPRPIPEPPRLPPTLEAPARPATGALKRIQSEPPAPSREEKIAPNLIVPGAPTPSQSEPPPKPRVELDLPIRPTAPTEAALQPQWQLPKPEPIQATPSAPTPPPADETPSMIGRRMHVDHLPGARMICGALPRADIVILIENPRGENCVVYSGTAPQYGVGGFELPVAENGKYIVTIGGQSLAVQVQDDTVFIQA
jgi:hypothetical protein